MVENKNKADKQTKTDEREHRAYQDALDRHGTSRKFRKKQENQDRPKIGLTRHQNELSTIGLVCGAASYVGAYLLHKIGPAIFQEMLWLTYVLAPLMTTVSVLLMTFFLLKSENET